MDWNSHCFKTSQEVENFHASAMAVMAVGRPWSHADGVDPHGPFHQEAQQVLLSSLRERKRRMNICVRADGVGYVL